MNHFASEALSTKEVEEFFYILSKENPDPRSELNFINPYTLLVAVVLSAQATDKSVNISTKHLFSTVDDPYKMVSLGEEKLKEYIKSIGLFNTKARNIISLSKLLIEKFNGIVPQSRDELKQLPGVGRKTANVVLNVAFGKVTFAVDTHVFRVCNRTGLALGKTPQQVELGLERIVPEAYALHAHHHLILHGRYVCKARKPDCKTCPVAALCKRPVSAAGINEGGKRHDVADKK